MNVRPQTHRTEIRDITVLEAAKYFIAKRVNGAGLCEFKKRSVPFGATAHEVVFYRKKMKKFQETEYTRRKRYHNMFETMENEYFNETGKFPESRHIWQKIYDQEYEQDPVKIYTI